MEPATKPAQEPVAFVGSTARFRSRFRYDIELDNQKQPLPLSLLLGGLDL